MILKVEHIGIAVKDARAAGRLYEALLNRQPYKEEVVEREGVRTLFFQTGETKIELLEAVKNDSAINKFIEKRGEGIHHIAFEVDDIVAEMNRLKTAGFELINDHPLPGADNKLIAFIHPRSTNGVLVELCQSTG